MPEYKIHFEQIDEGWITVEADNQIEAEQKARKLWKEYNPFVIDDGVKVK